MPTTGGSAEREGEICRGQDGVFGETPQGAYLTRRPPRRPEALFLDGDGVDDLVELLGADLCRRALAVVAVHPAPTAEPDPAATSESDSAPTTPATRASFERTPTPGESYAIQAGDTLSAVATRFGLTVESLLALNPEVTDASRIVVGQEILLREPTAAPAPSTDSDPPEAEAATVESEQAEPQQPTRPAREPAEEPQPAAAPAADDAQEDDDGGLGAAGAVIVLGVVGIGALVWWRRRTRTGSSDA